MRRSHNLLAPQWGKRWFSIEGRFLRWYRQESDVSPSGMIDLRHVRSITKVDINGSYTFCVSCEDRNLIMRANSLSEMNSWFRALHIHADIARGGSGMNVVSDFNEAPLRSKNILQSSRNSKSRNRLTLEEEIDLNLQKLNDLELEVSTPDFIIEEKAGDSFDNNSDALNDFHYDQQPTHRSKVANKRAPHQSSNPMAEPPTAYRPRPAAKVPQPKTAPAVKPEIQRSDSTESLENIPVTSRTRPARSLRNDEAATISYKQAPAARRVGRIPADGDISDEFDQSTDSVTPPKSFYTRSSGSRANHHGDAYESPSSSLEKKQSNRTSVRRFQAPSYDDDDAQFSNVSNMTVDPRKERHSSSHMPASTVLSGNHPLRNSSARAAWN